MFDASARRPIAVRFPSCGVFVLESHHARGFQMKPTAHDYLKIIVPFAGAGWLVRPGSRMPLRPHDVVLVPRAARHHLEDDGARPLSLYALCLAPANFPALPALFERFRCWAQPVWTAELRALIRHLLHEQTLDRPGSDLMRTGLAWQALAHLSRATSEQQGPESSPSDQPNRARVAAYAEQLQRTFYHRLTIDQAARSLGLSRRHFTQLFRELQGESWLTVVRRHRLTHARLLLRETDRSVASIAYECGFDDLTTFYRAFKSIERASPVEWRRRHR